MNWSTGIRLLFFSKDPRFASKLGDDTEYDDELEEEEEEDKNNVGDEDESDLSTF